MTSSPASRCGTGISEHHQGDPIPPRRSTRPHPQRSHCPGKMETDETTYSPFLRDNNPCPMPILLPSSPTQRRNQALAPLVPLSSNGPIDHWNQPSTRRGGWASRYLSCGPGIEGSTHSCQAIPLVWPRSHKSQYQGPGVIKHTPSSSTHNP